MHSGYTSSPGRLALGSKGPQVLPAITGHLGLGPRDRRVDQLSRVTQARVRMPAVSTNIPGASGPRRSVRVVDQAFGRLRPVPEGPRFRPGSRATLDRVRCCRAEHLSQGTRAWSEGTRGRPAVLGDSGPCQRAEGSTSPPGRLALGSEGPRGRPAVPGDSGGDPRAIVMDQHSWATRACILGQMGSTSYPGRLGLGLKTHRVDPMSRATPARLQGPAGWTSSPGPLALFSKGLRSRPSVTGNWGPVPKAFGVDQLSLASRARV